MRYIYTRRAGTRAHTHTHTYIYIYIYARTHTYAINVAVEWSAVVIRISEVPGLNSDPEVGNPY
jgi:hypothetical protein